MNVMRRPPSPTPVLVAEHDRKALSVVLLANNRETVCPVESLTVDGARIRSTMPMQVGEPIAVTFRGADEMTHTLDAIVSHVEAHELLNDRAQIKFVNVDVATRDWLEEFVRTLPVDNNSEFESDDEQVTHRRSVSDLSSHVDLDPPTLRKGK